MTSESPTNNAERPSMGRRVVRLLLWSVALLAAVLMVAWGLLQSDWIRERVRLAVERQAGEALGREVSIGSVDFELFSLTASAESIVIGGPEGLDEPLVEVGQLSLAVGPGILRSLWRGEPLVIEQIGIGDAVLDLRFAEDGTSNLPDLGKSEDSDGGLEVRVEALEVVGSLLRLEQRAVPLELTAEDVEATARAVERGHRATAESPRVIVRLLESEPLEVSLLVDARIGDGVVTLDRARLEAPWMEAEATGEIGAERLSIKLTGRAEAGLLNRLGRAERAEGSIELEAELASRDDKWSAGATWRSSRLAVGPLAVATLRGSLEGDRDGTVDGDRFWSFTGSWSADELAAGELRAFGAAGELEVLTGEPWSASGDVRAESVEVAGLAASAAWASFEGGAAGFEARLEQAVLAGGQLSGSATVPLGGATEAIDVTARLSALDLDRLLDAADPPLVTGLGGVVSATARYRFGTASPLQGTGSAEVRVEPTTSEASDGDILPLSGQVALEIAGGRVTTDRAVLEAPGQRIVVSGSFDLDTLAADLDVEVNTSDVAALLATIPTLRQTSGAEPWEPTHGAGEARGEVRVTSAGFSADVELSLEGLRLSGEPIERGSGRMVVDSGGIQSMSLRLEHEESWLEVEGSVPFDEAPAELPAPELGLEIRADRWRLQDAAPWVPMEIPVQGVVSGLVTLRGTLDGPVGTVELSVEEMTGGGYELPGSLSARVEYGPREVEIAAARYAAPFGDVELTGSVEPESGRLDLRLVSSPLDLAAPPVDVWIPGRLTGWVEISGDVRGTFDEPRADLVLAASGVDLDGRALGDGGRSRLELALTDAEVDVEGSLLGLISLDGGGPWSDDDARVEIDVKSEALAELLGLGLDRIPEDTSGALAGMLRITGAAGARSTRLELGTLELEHEGRKLRNLEPVVVSLGDAGLTLESLYLAELRSGSEFFLAGSFGSAADPELDMVVQSSIDASWLDLYLPDLDLEGRMEVLATIGGAPTAPRFDGQGRVVDGRLIVAGFPHAVEGMEGLVFLYPGQIVVDSAHARFARGELTAEGTIFLEGDLTGSYELRLRGKGLDLRYPEDWRILADGRLTLSSNDEGRVLSGVVEVERAIYARDFELGLMQLMRVMFERQPEVVDETDELLLETRLNISVQGPGALQVRTDVATLSGDLDFTVRGNMALPVILGDVRLERGGTIDLTGTEYMLERGSLVFSNPFRNDPSIDLVATATVREFDVRLNVFGRLDELQTSVSSTPPLPSLDVLSLLTTGSADLLGNVGRGKGGEAEASSAEAFLASQAASLAGARVGELFGLDQVRITPLTSGTSTLSTARLTVGKQISRDLYLTYSNDPSSSDKEVVELRWQVQPSIALILTGTDEESYTVDILWTKTF